MAALREERSTVPRGRDLDSTQLFLLLNFSAFPAIVFLNVMNSLKSMISADRRLSALDQLVHTEQVMTSTFQVILTLVSA
jgi:hypothetical protein